MHFITEFGYPPETQRPAQHWDLVLDCTLNQNLSLSLSVSVSVSVSVSLSLSLPLSLLLPPWLYLKSFCPKYNWGYPGWNISARRAVNSLPNIFTLSTNAPSKIQVVVQKDLLCKNRHTNWSHPTPTFQLSSLHVTAWPAHIYRGLLGPKFDSEITWGL